MVTRSIDRQGVGQLLDAGRDHANDGDLVAAAEDFGRALDTLGADGAGLAGDDRLLARAHLGLAFVRAESTGQVEEGITHLEAAARALPADAVDLQVALLGQWGILLFRAGRWHEALAKFVDAEEVIDRTTPSHRASMLLNRGLLRVELGQTDDARVDLERAVVEAAVADQPRTAYKARHNLALAAFVDGDLPRAIAGMAAAPVHANGTREDADPITLMDRGRVLLEAGLVEEADHLLAEAQEHFDHQQRGRDLGEVALFRAEAALVAGDLERSAELARAAVDDFTTAGNDRWRRRGDVVSLAVDDRRLAQRAGDEQADESALLADLWSLRRRALALAAEAADDPEVAVTARLVAMEAARTAGAGDTASAEFHAMAPPQTSSLRLRLRWQLARAALAPADAVQSVVEEGVAELAAAQAQVGSRDLRTAMALHGRALVERGIGAALAGGDLEVVHRAVDLAHAASTRVTPVRADLGDDDRRLLAELRAVESRQWREPDAALAARAGWDDRARALRQRLRQRSWRQLGDGDRTVDPVVPAPQWRTTLADTSAVGVSYFADKGVLRALCTDHGGSEVLDLGPVAPVMDLVERLRADLRVLHLPTLAPFMTRVVHASLVDVLARIDEAVVEPLEAGESPLVVVPHGGLALVPWCLLPGRRGRPTVSTSSATRWVRGRASSVMRREPPVVRALAGPGLVRASDEAEAVMACWGGRAPPGLATSGELLDALAAFDIVHLAAHGTHRRSSPLFSSVRLVDGPLFAHELTARARADLVVLSACDVGEQAIRVGDEALGFGAALLDAGVAVVVGSVAPIRDDVAAEIGRAIHARLAAGDSPAVAVAEATAGAWDDGAVAPLVVLGTGL